MTGRRVRTFPCVSVGLAFLTCEEVERSVEGYAQDRAAALLAIARRSPTALDWLFPERCDCGKNHRSNVNSLMRAYRVIPPSVRELCRTLPVGPYIRLATCETPEAMALKIAQLAFRKADLLTEPVSRETV